MAFVNVKKVDLGDTDNGIEAFSHTVLLLASITHDCMEKKDYKGLAFHASGLMHAAHTLLQFVEREELNGQGQAETQPEQETE